MRSTSQFRPRRMDAFRIKSGPTESGEPAQPPPSPHPVGGEMLPIDKLFLLISKYWLLIILVLLPLALILYKKRVVTLKFLTPLISRLFELVRSI